MLAKFQINGKKSIFINMDKTDIILLQKESKQFVINSLKKNIITSLSIRNMKVKFNDVKFIEFINN